jgi:hypothetical protein
MSKVVIQGHASGSGDFTIAAPNSNTDRTLTLPDETGTLDTLQRSGNVLQVVSTSGPGSTVSKTGAGELEIINAAITPSSTSSKIFITCDSHAIGVGGSNTYLRIQIFRDTTNIKNGPYGGIPSVASAAITFGTSLLDSPSSTSEITYSLKVSRVSSGTNGWESPASSSTITLMEIAG